MRYIKYDITKEEYDKYCCMGYSAAENDFLDKVDKDGCLRLGYGVYGFSRYKTSDDKYYVELEVGSSCD